MSLILSGCGGQPLSEREIVRGVLFTRQAEDYSACLVLADKAGESTADSVISAGRGSTPAEALANAEQALYGNVYYGLLDLVALPADADWNVACEIGEVLYENAQPAPELSVFILNDKPVDSWAKQGETLYHNMKSIESTYQVHCGLQQLFAQEDVSAVPAYTEGGGYDFVLLPQKSEAVRCRGVTEAQLAAVLCGQTSRLQGTFASGAAWCEARAQVTVDQNRVQLHLRDVRFSRLKSEAPENFQDVIRAEFQNSFQQLYQAMQDADADPFHLKFWQFCMDGPDSVMKDPQLEVIFE